jgi:excisionase family DNA binding protein
VKRQKQKSVGELQARGVVGLTKKQMAAAFQVCPRTITDMMRRGEISYWKIGRLVRFRMEDALKRMNETVLVAAEGGEE